MRRFGCAPLAAPLALAGGAEAAVINVPADEPTIQAAIAAAVSGADEVVVAPGIYAEHLSFLGKAITVRSTDPADPAVVAATIVDGTGSGRVVDFSSGEGPDSVLDGLTIANGSALNGAGARLAGASATITRCAFVGNVSSGSGGAVTMIGSFTEVTVTDCTFRSNRGSVGGALYIDPAGIAFAANVIGCTFTGNLATAGTGGAIRASGVIILNVTDCTLTGNTAVCGIDGGIYNDTLTPSQISGTAFCRNWPNDTTFFNDIGGNTFDDGCPNTVLLVGTDVATVQEGIARAANGDEVALPPGVHPGPIDFGGRSVTVRSTDGAAVTSIDGGGAARVVTVNDCEGSLAILQDLTITGGQTGGDGAGVLVDGSGPQIVGCIVTGNDAGGRGGGVRVTSDGVLTITGSTVSGNTADVAGGGVSAAAGADVTIADSAFCLNAPDAIDGIVTLDGLVYLSENPDCAPIVALGACCLDDACVRSAEADCLAAGGAYQGDDVPCSGACPAPCPGDFEDDGEVGFGDLLAVLTNWGPCP